MQFFIVEGVLKKPELMNDTLLKEHISYTQKAMQKELYLLSGLKEDQTGGIFIIKAENKEALQSYLENEPFYKAGMQTYKITAFDTHYTQEAISFWFQK